MGTNACWIQVKVDRKVTPQRILAELERYWTKHGARVAGRRHEPLEPLTLEQSRRLGYVMREPDRGFAEICDSVRYYAHYPLAQYLAKVLDTPVRFIGIWDGSGHVLEKWLGPRFEPAGEDDHPITPGLYYSDEEAKRSPHAVVFEGVDPAVYDRGPEPLEG